MAPADQTRLTRSRLSEFFQRAFTPRAEWRIGMELEKMGRRASDGKPIPYLGSDPSIHSFLAIYMAQRGGVPIYDGMHIIGLDGPYGTITLEPAGQVEWSSRPCDDLGQLQADLLDHLAALDTIGRRAGIEWLDVAVDPVHPVTEMPWMPKARYEIMRPYMGRQGRLAHRMMTQTASIQCSYDFENADDWTAKFRAAALLSPVAVALFANSSRIDGKPTGYRSYRQAIWMETDPDRCGLPSVVFEPGFDMEAWIDWACTVPTLFYYKNRNLVPGGGIPFDRVLEHAGCKGLTMADWELQLSSIFTDVRSYTYIEVRCADLQHDHLAFAVPALWTGILYHGDSLAAGLELGSPVDDYGKWREAMESAARHGLDGEAGGRPIRELAAEMLRLSAAGLSGGAACSTGLEDPVSPLRLLDEELDLGALK